MIEIDTKFTKGKGIAEAHDAIRDFIATAGSRLEDIFINESMQRADGLGNPDGAFDRGELSGSIRILKRDWNQVTVGTKLKRAKDLALGLPQPDASLDAIRQWRRRKEVPRRSKYVWNKVRTKGPTPNPFHIRAEKEFAKELPELIRKVELK